MEYTTVKFIHLLGAVLFLGNIIVTAVWKSLADRTGNPVIIAFACRLVNITDLAFTALGAALVVIGGIGLFHAGGIAISDSPHLTIGISLFAMAAVLWLTGLLPLQLYMSKLAAKTVAAGQATMPEAYGKCVKLWTVLGIIATVLPLGTLWFMIAR
ncbi:DUF2269 family protein [Thalassospira alkalitolerans]|uniref:DUF2269 family protein n=1 Tax=Thalassospira alkalitolerans TaxID=1293890 RepID=UPI0030EC53BF|tara:strand:+ start:84659 stop:85126 length:468 start_codon:yes stop_codon:yes gene_type:complete